MTRLAAFGIVTLAAADLRREPRHDSELLSQLLLGETVRIGASRDRGQWLRVRGEEDGYAGWMRAWSLVRVGAAAVARWRARARWRVTAPIGALREVEGAGDPLMPVFLGSRLERLGGSPRRALIRLPGGRRAVLTGSALAPVARLSIGLRERVRSLMGVPYLWGGRTPAGFDCSGFTQVTLDEQGISLPRDARLQFRATRPLGRLEPVREGDLVFFGRVGEPVSHVGIMLDRCSFVHCRGWVRMASLDPENALCEKELLPQMRGVRRAGIDRRRARRTGVGRAKSA